MCCTEKRFRWNDGRIKAGGSFLSLLLPPMPCDVWKGCTEADIKSTIHPGHISSYLRQHKHRSSVIRGETDLSFSYLCTQILSITLFCPFCLCLSLYAFLCPFQTEGFCHLNLLLFILGHHGMCMSTRLLICMTRSRRPITWVQKWKVNCWSASTICFLCLHEQVWDGNTSFVWNWSVHVRGQ